MFSNQTLRLIVHSRADGTAVRIRLSNTSGDRPVTFGRTSVGLSAGGGAVIMLEGVNDLRSTTPPATAAQIIAGYRQIIARVHARGARILGATITPVEGSARYDANMEQQRQAINKWIQTSGAFDGVVDFAAAVADPADPLRLLPAYDSGDHLHPNNAGYQAMGNAINLKLVR